MTGGVDLLCTGDLHLGRHPTRIPERLDGQGLSPAAVWRATVDHAVEQGVDAVVLTGDVIDRANRYFEAFGAVEGGLTDLAAADIPVVAVAGNHDAEALPDLVDAVDIESLQFLGRGGEWERWTLARDGQPLVHFDGWSFPAEHVYESPLDGYEVPAGDGAPVVGVVHADVDSPGSHYAPVDASALRGTPAAAWLLGHIHSPGTPLDGDPLALYPGSPQPLDPGERGAHGPWHVSIGAQGAVDVEQVPLATVRYEQVEVDVADTESAEAATAAIAEAVSSRVESATDTGALEVCLVRVRLTGRTPAHADLVDRQRSMQRDLAVVEGGVDVRIERIDVDTRPAVDLEGLAEGDDAAAHLATLLLDIEAGEASDHHGEVVDDALAAMRQAHSASAYSPLRRKRGLEKPTEEEAIETLEQQARLLLDTLVRQREGTA